MVKKLVDSQIQIVFGSVVRHLNAALARCTGQRCPRPPSPSYPPVVPVGTPQLPPPPPRQPPPPQWPPESLGRSAASDGSLSPTHQSSSPSADDDSVSTLEHASRTADGGSGGSSEFFVAMLAGLLIGGLLIVLGLVLYICATHAEPREVMAGTLASHPSLASFFGSADRTATLTLHREEEGQHERVEEGFELNDAAKLASEQGNGTRQ